MINRCYATILVGKFLPIINDLRNSNKIIERIVKKLLFQFKLIYPKVINSDIHNDEYYFSSRNLVKNGTDLTLMIYSLRSLGVFINTPPCLNDNFMRYFDLLLEMILSVKSNKYLQIEALHIINNYYPRTYRGRLRIEQRFREKVSELSHKYELDIRNGISKKLDFLQKIDNKNNQEKENENTKNDQTNENINTNKDQENENVSNIKNQENENSNKSTLKSENINEEDIFYGIDDKENDIEIEETINKMLFNKLNTFWSVWYPIVPDKIIVRIPNEQINEGYIFYRMKYLINKTKVDGIESFDMFKKKKIQLKYANMIDILRTSIDVPYAQKENNYLIENSEVKKCNLCSIYIIIRIFFNINLL